MKKNPFYFIQFFALLCLSLLVYAQKEAAPEDKSKFKYQADKLSMDMGGKLVNECYAEGNMFLLNDQVGVDSLFYLRTTADYFFSIIYNQRLHFYDTLRFRFKWGTATETKNGDSFVTVADTKFTVKGTATNKHLVWMREGWLKIFLSENVDLKNYIQIGLIPYQVGRGISLGAAYDATGFLGFIPGSPIDQYAPGIVGSFNPIQDRLIIEAYWAMTENNQTSLSQNLEIIRGQAIDECGQRGVSRQAFLAALRGDVLVYQADKKKINVEPYFVYQHAPDQDVEFANDVDTFVSAAGLAVEGTYHRFNWGFEAAKNFGEIDFRAWDRNAIQMVKNSDGFVIEQYTKVYTQDPATVSKPAKAPASDAVAKVLKASPLTRATNGKEIGVALIDGVETPLYNSFDRIRPAQRKILEGYFVVADCTYDIIPKEIALSLGVGYASGYNDPQKDTNKLTPDQLLNEHFTGFLPIQSIYSGKRLRHLVIFNQGVPRFNVLDPNADLSLKNVTSVFQSDIVNEMTNIAFAGGRLEWKVPQMKSHSVTFAQNIIGYWVPAQSSFKDPKDPKVLHESSNALGTEFTTEFSGVFLEKLRFMGYLGIFVPGQHYKDMCGTTIASLGNLPTGADIAYTLNVAFSYLF